MAEETWPRFLDCPVCDQPYNIPKILPCFHTFCTPCLRNVAETDSVRCPLCKDRQRLVDVEIEDFPNNTFVMDLIDHHRFLANESPELLCRVCTARQGQSYCDKCQLLFCGDCRVMHSRLPATEGHNHGMMSTDDYRRQVLIVSPFKRNVMCPEHYGMDLTLYCVFCHVPVCTECVYVRHEHPEHAPGDINEVLPDKRLDLRRVCDSTHATLEEKKSLKSILDAERDVSASKMNVISAEIGSEANAVSAQLQDLQNDIRRQEDQLLLTLEKKYNKREDALNEKAGKLGAINKKLSKSIKMAEQLLEQNNEAAFLLMANQVLQEFHNLQSVDCRHNRQPTMGFSQADHPPTVGDQVGILGRVKVTDRLNKKGINPDDMQSPRFDIDDVVECGNAVVVYPTGLTVLPDERVIVADAAKEALLSFNRNGVYLQPIAEDHPVCPASITTLQRNQVLVTDCTNSCVHRFSVYAGTYKYLGNFGNNIKPFAITTSQHGHIFVVDGSTLNILNIAVFNLSFQSMQPIPVYGGGSCTMASLATNSKDDLILLQHDLNKVTVMDFTGAHKSSTHVADSLSVTISACVAADQYDNVIICGWGKIKVYSPTLRLITCIDEIDQNTQITSVAVFPYSPYRIALADADKKCVKIYRLEDAG